MSTVVSLERTIIPGVPVVVSWDCPASSFGVMFEDDGQTGYVYAVQNAGEGSGILDALMVYQMRPGDQPSSPRFLTLRWAYPVVAVYLDSALAAAYDFHGRRRFGVLRFPPPGQGWMDTEPEWVEALFKKLEIDLSNVGAKFSYETSDGLMRIDVPGGWTHFGTRGHAKLLLSHSDRKIWLTVWTGPALDDVLLEDGFNRVAAGYADPGRGIDGLEMSDVAQGLIGGLPFRSQEIRGFRRGQPFVFFVTVVHSVLNVFIIEAITPADLWAGNSAYIHELLSGVSPVGWR